MWDERPGRQADRRHEDVAFRVLAAGHFLRTARSAISGRSI
jgi:hypothetical protein